MTGKRRFGLRFWYDLVGSIAAGLVLLILIVGGIWFVFAQGLPWLGAGLTDLAAGDFNFASVLALVLFSVVFILFVSGFAGFGAEYGRSLARQLRGKRN